MQSKEERKCQCCKGCSDFQQIYKLKNTGLVIYRYASEKNVAEENSECLEKIPVGDVYIFHNTSNFDIATKKYFSQIGQYIKCARCKYVFEHAYKLLRNISQISKFGIIGLCEYCKSKIENDIPCKHCNEAVKKFIIHKNEKVKKTDDFIQWANKFKNIFEIDKRKSRSHPSLFLNKQRISISNLLHEPEGQLRGSETKLQTSINNDKQQFDSSLLKRNKQESYSPSYLDSKFPEVESLDNTIDLERYDKELRLKKFNDKKNKQTVYSDTAYRRRKNYELKLPSKYVHISLDDINAKFYDFDLPHLQRKYSSHTTLSYQDDIEKSDEYSMNKIFKQDLSKKNDIFKPNRDTDKISIQLKKEKFFDISSEKSFVNFDETLAQGSLHKSFSFFFIKESNAQPKNPRITKSSSELIKETYDVIREKAEKEKERFNETKNISNETKIISEETKIKDNQMKEAKIKPKHKDEKKKEKKNDEEIINKNHEIKSKAVIEETKEKVSQTEKKTTLDDKTDNATFAKPSHKKTNKNISKTSLTEPKREKGIVKKHKEEEKSIKKDVLKVEKESIKVKKEQDKKQVEKESIKVKKEQDKKQVEKESIKVKKEQDKKQVEKESIKVKKEQDKQQVEKESIKVKKEQDKKQQQVEKALKEIIKKEEKQKTEESSAKEKVKNLDKNDDLEEIKKMLAEQKRQKEEEKRSKKKEEDNNKVKRDADQMGTNQEVLPKNEETKNQMKETKSNVKQEIKPKDKLKVENAKTKDLQINQIRVRTPSTDDLILRLVKLKQSYPRKDKERPKRLSQINVDPNVIAAHKCHQTKQPNCIICNDSELELDIENIVNKKFETPKVADVIIGEKILKHKPHLEQKVKKPKISPLYFTSTLEDEVVNVPDNDFFTYETEGALEKKTFLIKNGEQEVQKGIIRYALSDRSFIDKGWTMLPTEKVVRKMNVYRMRPAHPEFDWFEHNKNKKVMLYDTEEKLAEFDDVGRGRWFYRNGKLALDYYDAEEINAQQRFVIYSNGEPDERGRSRPFVILATFDYLGNGIVFDHAGKIRLKYNQTEGVVLDRSIGPVSHWKWHTLNDPPVLQQVMIDTQMAHKDPEILKLGGPADDKVRPDNEEMLAIEFENFIKEKSKKLSQKFKPFQIKMKALKINENFSLKVLDQATVYLIFRDGSTNLKINIGMILDHKEIVDTDTAEVGEVSNSLERFPARTDSLAGLQKSVAHAQRIERARLERERRLRPTEPYTDKVTSIVSRPLRTPLNKVPSSTTVTTADYMCRCRKYSSCQLYYDTRLN